MAQRDAWEKEYQKPLLLTKENKPQSDVVRFVKFLKEQGVILEGKRVLDLGSGTGRNSNYFAELGCIVDGIEISKTAVSLARKYSTENNLNIDYYNDSLGEPWIFLGSRRYDVLLDVTSSNSLSEEEREVFLAEAYRVLNPDGYFFTKALCKDGDENAKYLIKTNPGKEKDTYIMPGLGVEERVWSKEDFVATYSKHFRIMEMEKKTSYSRMNGRVYKRNFWIVYMKKS
jgi:cyclopropane fatty-acyl-phospholipid synthase-like methyltransferase